MLRLEDGGFLQRRKLLDLVDEVGSDALTTGADTLDQGKFLDIDLGRTQLTTLLLTPDEEAWIVRVGQEQQLVLGVLPEDILTLLIFLDAEALDVMVLLIGIVVDSRPDLAGLILLDTQEVLLDMDGVAEVGGIAFALLEDDEDAVTGVEGAEVLALLVVVQAQDIAVEPYVTPTERREALTQERYRVHLSLRH